MRRVGLLCLMWTTPSGHWTQSHTEPTPSEFNTDAACQRNILVGLNDRSMRLQSTRTCMVQGSILNLTCMVTVRNRSRVVSVFR